MERQNRMLTVLATVLLVLVAIVVFGRQPEDVPSDPDAPPERALFEGFESDAAQSLTLTNPSGTLTFTKTDGEWKMTAPREMAVEQRRVDEIVDRFASLKVQEEALPGDLASFGLDGAGRMSVTIATTDGKTLTAFVGRDAPVGYRSYVAEKAEGPALLASSKVGDLVGRTADDFRSKEIWRVSTGSAKRVRIEDAGQAVVLRKDDSGWWLGDEGPRASTKAVEDWLARASFLRADSFLDDVDPAAVGLAPPAATLTVEDGDGTHVLEVGNRDDTGVVVRSGGQVFRVGSETTELLQRTGWASDELMPVRAAQIDTIEITLGEKTARFTKTDGAWKDAAGADSTAPTAILDAIGAAKADRTARVDGPTAKWGSITLSEGTTRTESITIGQELTNGDRAAKDAAGGPTFRVPAESIAAIAATLP